METKWLGKLYITTSLESWLVREIIPKWPNNSHPQMAEQVRLVKHDNLPRNGDLSDLTHDPKKSWDVGLLDPSQFDPSFFVFRRLVQPTDQKISKAPPIRASRSSKRRDHNKIERCPLAKSARLVYKPDE